MRIVSWFRSFVLCLLKLIGFVSAIHSEDPVNLCLSSLWMAQCNITFYIVVFNLDIRKMYTLSGTCNGPTVSIRIFKLRIFNFEFE